MDRERLFKYLEQRYSSKNDLLSRIPLGVQPELLWQDLLNKRRAGSTILPLYGASGKPYWYFTTAKMVAASEKIVEALFENESDIDPYASLTSVSNLEEVFFTSFVEGSQMTMQAAMDFLTSDSPPRDIEEQLIANNRQASSFAAANIYRGIDADFLRDLAYILTDGMDGGGQDYRMTDEVDYISQDGGNHIFPSAESIPSRINDLCRFLQAEGVHPLVKAAVAQAYFLTVRPFAEGNERLGRILSYIILIRSGYTFFSEISLSALIAKRSYAYYEAMMNILSEENEGDLTYFVEYFIVLLARAVDERRLRNQQKDAQARQSEQEMAYTALKPTVSNATENGNANAPKEGGDGFDGFFTITPTEETQRENEQISEDLEIGIARVKDRLYQHTLHDGTIIKKCAELMLKFIENGKLTFTIDDLGGDSGIAPFQAANLITHLKEDRLIVSTEESENKHRVYRINTDLPPLSPKDYDADIIETVKKLKNSIKSTKDQRVAEVILSCLPKGIITIDDFGNEVGRETIRDDMILTEQIGITERICFGVYRINRQRNLKNIVLNPSLKRTLTMLYNEFGSKEFTGDMALAILHFSNSYISSMLHRFTLMRITDCKEGITNTYRLLVNPTDNPTLFSNEPVVKPEPYPQDQDYSEEILDIISTLSDESSSSRDRRVGDSLKKCLEKGKIETSDYRDWGYSMYMWSSDIAFAKQLGLISFYERGVYTINRELKNDPKKLLPYQKKAIKAIYEAFGDKEFSSDILIATLSYSFSYTEASLQKFTLMRIVRQKNTENGTQYQLLVNPQEHPEYFTDVA